MTIASRCDSTGYVLPVQARHRAGFCSYGIYRGLYTVQLSGVLSFDAQTSGAETGQGGSPSASLASAGRPARRCRLSKGRPAELVILTVVHPSSAAAVVPALSGRAGFPIREAGGVGGSRRSSGSSERRPHVSPSGASWNQLPPFCLRQSLRPPKTRRVALAVRGLRRRVRGVLRGPETTDCPPADSFQRVGLAGPALSAPCLPETRALRGAWPSFRGTWRRIP